MHGIVMSYLQRRACHGVVAHNGAASSHYTQLLWLLHTQPRSEHAQPGMHSPYLRHIFGDSKRNSSRISIPIHHPPHNSLRLHNEATDTCCGST